MKILNVVHGFPPYNLAGTEVYTYNLCREVSKGHRVSIFHRINNLHIKEYSLAHNRIQDLEVFAINNTFRNCGSFEMTYRNDKIAEKFGKVLEQIKPDIVHIQHLLYLSIKIIEEIKKKNIPIVFTLHDYWLICPQGQLFKNNTLPCDRETNPGCYECILYQLSIKKHIFNLYYFLKRFTPGPLFRIVKDFYLNSSKAFFLTRNNALNLIEERTHHMKSTCSKIDLFISPSEFLKKKFIEFGIPEEKILFSPYGLNLENLKGSQKIASANLRFGFIGNLLPAKGAHVLIEAFNKVKDNNAVLIIYGKIISYKGALGNYLNRIKKIAKNVNIKFMGGFDNKDVAKIFREIDVLVVPSIWHENSPLVIQEAFAVETPVIASRTGGIPELIEDGRNGLLFEPNNVNDLYKKINLVIESPSLLEDIRKNIEPPKDIKENAKEIEGIYNKLISVNKI